MVLYMCYGIKNYVPLLIWEVGFEKFNVIIVAKFINMINF